MKIIDESKNSLEYKSEKPIIYLADYYFSEILNSSKIRKTIKEFIAKDQLYCNNSDKNLKRYLFNKFKLEFKIKKDSEFKIEKIVLKKKIAYSNIL